MTKMRLRPVNHADVRHVVERLREKDREEVFATQFTDDPEAIVDACMAFPFFGWTAQLDEPIAAIGAAPLHPGVWSVYAFGTDRFPEIAYPLTKFIKKAMIPSLASSGCRRAQCLSLASHTEAHKWLTYLGAEPAGSDAFRGFGRNGEDFILYLWQRPENVPSRPLLA